MQISGGIFSVYIIQKDHKQQDRHEWQLKSIQEYITGVYKEERTNKTKYVKKTE